MRRWTNEDHYERLTIEGRIRIGAAIRRARLNLGLSQHGLAWRVGLNQSTISRIESGKLMSLRFRNLALIAGVLILHSDVFLTGGPPAPTRRMPHQPPTPPDVNSMAV